MTIDNDIEFKKWIAVKIGRIKYGDNILVGYNYLMQAVEKINTSSGEYYIEMGQKSWSVYKLLKDKKELAKYCHWIDNNGMLGALKETIYYIYKESMK